MNFHELKWSSTEKKIARAAYNKAIKNEMTSIREEIKRRVDKFREDRDVWRLHDYLSKKRREFDRKYDYRYSVLIIVFGRLLSEGFIDRSDIDGLKEDKLSVILKIAEGI